MTTVISPAKISPGPSPDEPLLPNAHPIAERVEREFLPYVVKPGRYIGNEWGTIHKEHAGRVKVCLAFPDAYELGMSYLGTAILGNLINQQDDCLAERVFAPWPDAEERLRKTKLPLFSLESFTPLNEFDFVGFSLSYELLYTNVLTMLDLGGIPLRSADRTENDPIIMAGGSIVYNPEPIAAFFDLFLIGDGEDALMEMLPILRDKRDGKINRSEAVMQLARIAGVYHPAGYEVSYDASGVFEKIEPVLEDRPALVKSRQCLELKNSNYPETPIVPFIEITHDRLSVEIMRGCVRNCRFCQAGYIYLPKRGRTVEDLIRHVIDSLNNTGWDEVTLLSLLSTDFKGLESLAGKLTDRLTPKRISISLPSIRPGTFSLDMAKKIAQVRRSGLTFAPEAGSYRMRRVINKMISDEDMLENAKIAFENGWRQIKLYFMIGLPGERDEDLDAIIELTRKVLAVGRKAGIRPQLNITISPFSPKSHTPFQWEAQIPIDEIHRKHAYLRDRVKRLPIRLKLRDPRVSFLEGVLGRSDRRVADVIETAWRNGARFDAWKEWFNFEIWEKAFAEVGIDPHQFSGTLPLDRTLPWTHIDKGNLTTEFLMRQRARAWEAAESSNDQPLGKEEMPFAEAEPGLKSDSEDKADVEIVFPQFSPDENVVEKESEFGRRPRRQPQIQAKVSPTRSKIRFRWAKGAPVRFISHLDCMRTMERSIRRADVPAAFTEGFNPHIKLSFGPPLPLGYTSDDEYFDLQTDEVFTDRMFRRFQNSLPRGFKLVSYLPVYNTRESLAAMLNRATYRITLEADIPDAALQVEQFLKAEEVDVFRPRKQKLVNIRPSVVSLTSEHDGSQHEYTFTLKLGEPGVAKALEVLTAVTQATEEVIASARVTRTQLYTERGGIQFSPLAIS